MSVRFDSDLIPSSPNLEFEHALWQASLKAIAGLDEAGRGAWAGPVAAAAVILPEDDETLAILREVRDSKQLSPEKRTQLAPLIQAAALAWAVGMSSAAEIDALGILPATRQAMLRALNALHCQADHLLIDALLLPDVDLPQTALIKGDQRSLSIAAASVLAKTARDTWMCAQDLEYSDYGFARHKGYGTGLHQAQLGKFGPCPIHRKSFAPIREILEKQ